MCLLFLLITNSILFSLFTISPCALSVDNNDKNKDSIISSTKVSNTEGSGSVPVNEILSDDEDFFSSSSSIDFSGDGSLDSHIVTSNNNNNNHNQNNNNGHTIVTDPGNHLVNPEIHNHGDGDKKDEEEGDNEDEEDDDDEDDLDDSEDDDDHSVGSGGVGNGDNHPIEGDTHTSDSDNHNHLLDHQNVNENDTSTMDNIHTINNVNNFNLKQDSTTRPVSILVQPSMLAAVIGGIVLSLLCAILLAMFIIYRTRKKDEGSYICEPNLTSPGISHYGKASSNKFYDP